MTMKNQNFEMKKGDYKSLSVSITRSGDLKPVDLGIFEVKWTLYRDYGNRLVPVTTKSSEGSGVLVTDATNGVVSIAIESTDTKDLNDGNYYYEIQLVNANGQTSTVTTGTIFLFSKL